MYLVGKIVGTHGIKGEVKVKSESDFNRFKKGNTLYIKKDNKDIEIVINSHRVHKDMDLITFNNKTNINDVLEYVECNIYTKHLETDLEDGEYFIEDIVGLKLYSTNDEYLGEVTDMIVVPQGYILEARNDKKKILIPFVDEFIKEIKDDRIIVETIEGLL